MKPARTHFEKTVLLTLGQVAGLGISFVIPMFLSRHLTVEGYGTYKQLLLIHTLLLLTVHMGMDWGLFYFIKRDPRRAALFSLNAIWVDFAMAALVVALGLGLREQLAHALNNPELAIYLPAFAPFVLFSIPSHHFNHYLTVLDRIKPAMWLTVLFEMAKTAIIIACYYFFNSLWLVLLGLGALSLLRLAILYGWNLRLCRQNNIRSNERWSFLPEQVRFALPLGAGNLVSLVLKLDRFVVSALFGLRHFTLYSVGCFEVPVVESTVITMADLMSFDMVEARKKGDADRLKTLWHSTLRKIALLHIPLSAFMLVFAEEVITFIYSNAYAESASYFRVFSLIFLLAAFTPEVVFRVFAENRRLLNLRLLSAVYTLGLVIGGALWLGPIGALYGKLTADLVSATLQLSVIGRLLHLSPAEWLPWQEMGIATLLTLTSAFTLHTLMAGLEGSRFVLLAVSFALYGLLVFLVAAWIGLIRRDEIATLRRWSLRGAR